MGTVTTVILKPAYAAFAAAVAMLVFTFAVWLPNWRLVLQILSSSDVTAFDKFFVLWSLYGSIGTNFTLLSASYTIAIAILFGVNVAMLAYYVKARRNAFEGSGTATGIGGLASGVFGIGCASCGTFLLSSALALVGGAGVLSFFPLGGEEFGILGVALLGYSVYWTGKKIADPMVCEVDA